MQTLTDSRTDKLFKEDPGFRLLKSRSASFVVTFLYNTFHVKNRMTITYEEFEEALKKYMKQHLAEEASLLEDLREDNGETEAAVETENSEQRARRYIEDWYSEKREYLRHYRNEKKEEILELSAGIRRLFSWIDHSLNTEFVAAESGFSEILEQLRGLNEKINDDPVKRIQMLEEKKKAIDKEIQEILATGEAKAFTPGQISEYLRTIQRRAQELMGDFVQVEQNFRTLLSDITQKQAEESATKGSVFGYTLDLEKDLRTSPQGQSFNGFWSYMIENPNDEINTLTSAILEKAGREGVEWNDPFLLSLRPNLFKAGLKVVEKNNQLTERMGKVLMQSEHYSRDHKVVSETIAAIKAKATGLRDDERRTRDLGLTLETTAELSFPLSRNISIDLRKSEVAPIEYASTEASVEDILSLRNQYYVDLDELRERIKSYRETMKGQSFPLVDLLGKYPVEKGLGEIVSYLKIAEEENGTVDESRKDTLLYRWEEKEYQVEIPRIEFK